MTSGTDFPADGVSRTITFTNTFPGNKAASCSFDVTVFHDGEAPVVTVPSPITTGTDPGACSAVVTFDASAEDACDGALLAECTPASGSVFPVGVTTVTCTAVDVAGNPASETFTVTIEDTEDPAIIVPENIGQDNDQGQCSASVTFIASATDNCPGTTVECDHASGDLYGVGTTSVSCTATDAADNTASGSFDITVSDSEDPVITVPENIGQDNDEGQCGASVTFATSANDNCPGATVECDHASGDLYAVGTTSVSCTATDAADNTASGSFDITVSDTEAPKVTLNSASPSSLWPPNHSWRDVSLDFDASDNCDAPQCSAQVAVADSPKTWGEAPEEGQCGLSSGAIVDTNTGDDSLVRLCAERNNGKTSRVYTITYVCIDTASNTATSNAATVTVADSQSKGAKGQSVAGPLASSAVGSSSAGTVLAVAVGVVLCVVVAVAVVALRRRNRAAVVPADSHGYEADTDVEFQVINPVYDSDDDDNV